MNKVILIGNLTKDPELSETQSGVAVCRFSIAVSRDYTNADGERETDFFNISVWRGKAEACGKYLKKGNKCAVVGSLQNRTVEDGHGDRKTYTEIVASEVEFLTPKTKDEPETQTAVKYRQQEIGLPERPKAKDLNTRPHLEEIDDNNLPF